MNTQAWMSKRFFSFFLTWGIFLPYWSGWMILTKGVSVAEVSLIMSCGLLIRGISTLFLFPYLAEKVSSKTLLHVAGVGALLAFCFYIPATTFWQLLIVTVLVHIFYPAIMPALESIASILVQNNALKQYGKARQWGSIGFISIGIFITFFYEPLWR